PEPFHFDSVVEQTRAAALERGSNRGARLRRTVAEETSAAARAAYLGRGGTCRRRGRHQRVDFRRCHTRCQALAVFPFLGNLPADFVPLLPFEGHTHRRRRVPDPFEAI